MNKKLTPHSVTALFGAKKQLMLTNYARMRITGHFLLNVLQSLRGVSTQFGLLLGLIGIDIYLPRQ
jgi:hypothetical protein